MEAMIGKWRPDTNDFGVNRTVPGSLARPDVAGHAGLAVRGFRQSSLTGIILGGQLE